MSSQREYNIDKLIRDFESDDAVAALLGENDTYGLANFIYFRNPENVNSLISKIFELDVNRRMRVIKGLVSLYPISATILFPIIKSVKSEEIEADLAEWFDISETYVMTFNKLITAADRSGDKVEAKYKSALDEKIKTLADLREENKELHNLKIENESKRKEIENLERENKELKTKYSKENIERQIADLKSENDKWKKKETEANEYIIKLEKDLQTVKGNGENTKFRKAMEKFKQVVETLPSDEVDK